MFLYVNDQPHGSFPSRNAHSVCLILGLLSQRYVLVRIISGPRQATSMAVSCNCFSIKDCQGQQLAQSQFKIDLIKTTQLLYHFWQTTSVIQQTNLCP